MRHAVLLPLVLFLGVSASAAPAARQEDRGSRPARKGDSLTVRGCLSGGALEASDVSAPELSALVAAGLTFRLRGDKALLAQLRDRHDRKVVEVRGILKSDPPKPAGESRSVGNMRIRIGTASPAAGRLESEPRRVLPVLEVTSFNGTGQTSCGR